MTNHLIIGYGNIGKALSSVFNTSDSQAEYRIELLWQDPLIDTIMFDFIHICFPDSPSFVQYVCAYLAGHMLSETIIIIHSTVKPGTTKMIAEIFPRTVYSPVRGSHPHLKQDLLIFTKFFSTENTDIIDPISQMYTQLGISSVGIIEDPTILEYAKHFNTEWRLMQIIHAQDIAKVIRKHNLSITTIRQFINSTGDRKLPSYAQQVGIEENDLCLLPNAKRLNTSLAKKLIELNEEFGAEFGSEKVILE